MPSAEDKYAGTMWDHERARLLVNCPQEGSMERVQRLAGVIANRSFRPHPDITWKIWISWLRVHAKRLSDTMDGLTMETWKKPVSEREVYIKREMPEVVRACLMPFRESLQMVSGRLRAEAKKGGGPTATTGAEQLKFLEDCYEQLIHQCNVLAGQGATATAASEVEELCSDGRRRENASGSGSQPGSTCTILDIYAADPDATFAYKYNEHDQAARSKFTWFRKRCNRSRTAVQIFEDANKTEHSTEASTLCKMAKC